MRTYITYIFLGLIGFSLWKLTKVEMNLFIIVLSLTSIPIIEYLINLKHHKKNSLYERMKSMSQSELNVLLGDEQPKSIQEFASNQTTSPRSFGYKTNWLVVKCNDIDKVLKDFNYSKIVRTNWEKGVNATFENRSLKFICPSINNWTIIVDDGLSYVNSSEMDSKLKYLSRKYEEAYLFGSFRGTGFASWAKYKNGKEIRSFLIDDGDIFYSSGVLEDLEIQFVTKRTNELNIEDKEEMEYHQKFNYLNLLGTEDDVLMMANLWTVNPMNLHKYENRELGYLIE